MRWMVWNLFGCVFWLAGLAYARGLVTIPSAPNDTVQLWVGVGFALVGLALLVWTNLAEA